MYAGGEYRGTSTVGIFCVSVDDVVTPQVGSQTTNCHYGFTGYGPCMLTGSSSGINSDGSPDGKSQCGIFYNQVWDWDIHGGIGSLSSIIIVVN